MTAGPSEKVRDAIAKMVERNVGSIIVAEGGAPVGILTERDVLRIASKDVKALGSEISRVMTKPVETIPPTTPILTAVEWMHQRKIRRLPVVGEDRKLVGIVTERDMVKWFLEKPELLQYARKLGGLRLE